MRRLTLRTKRSPVDAQDGMTLVELMIGLAIVDILLVAAAPAFSDYIINARLRESGNLLYSQALIAQSEAIKRNNVVRLSTAGSVIQVVDRSDPGAPVVLHERRTAEGVTLSAADVDFGGQGWPLNFGAAAVDLATAAGACSSQIRCPGLRVDGGGGVRLCGDHTAVCP